MMDYRLADQSALEEDDNVLAEAVIEPIWNLPSADYATGELPSEWTGVSRGQRWVYALVWLERECVNGGLAQYFWNSAGVFDDDLREATKTMGLTALGEVYSAAAAGFDGGRPPRSSDDCREAMSRMARPLAMSNPDYEDDDDITILNDLSPWRDSNRRLNGLLEENETFHGPIAAYIRNHVDEFFA
ncbi:MAG TPA: DUF4375 domain-containing protein [Phycisphaerae bacterium]|nr:DUF4375 domain-containing protein [Phycisphaerae bacterium]HRW54942.1 DUF4375 domain-containing protein [Phycisphaerae bacterium]